MLRRKTLCLTTLVGAAVYIATATCLAQTPSQQNPTPQSGQDSASAPARANPQNDALAQLSPEQREKYNTAVQFFTAQDYSGALGIFRQILPQLSPGTPSQVLIAKFAAEAAINAGDREFALNLLKPIEAADPTDWQAAALLARLYAEAEQKQLRDAELAHLIDLHKRAVSPQIANMQQVLLERIPIKNGSIRIWYSLEPWGRYKTYLFSRIYDESGHQVFRVTLESSDFDQPFFVKEHPDLASQGMRRFSLDGYGQEQRLPNGQTSQTHSTFGFYDGQPSYDTVRERIIEIANGTVKPITSSPKVVPQ